MDPLFLLEKATAFLKESPKNRVEELGIEEIFSLPLMAVASAHDPLFLELKDSLVIGPHHLTPTEWLPGARTVLSYFLPFSSVIREKNRISGFPAQEWLYGRIEGEEVNDALRKYLSSIVQEEGGQALVPPLSSRYTVIERRSNYSERHVAYIAGLGTFGLSRSLITCRGSAGRFGSLILTLEMPITPRPYKTFDEYCNHCGDCISRCPAGAISVRGKDTERCATYLQKEIRPRFTPRYGCGKCQTAVMCESSIPEGELS